MVKNAAKVLAGLVPLCYNLAIATMVLPIAIDSIGKMFGEEIKNRLLEFKLMNVIEIEKIDKGRTIEYRKLDSIKNYIQKFLKENPKWVSEEEDYCGIKTGRIILTRVYRRYRKKPIEPEYCECCGRDLYG